MSMHKPFFFTGEAGAGKTRRLMEQAAALSGQLLARPHQRVLAMAVMHGARRHLRSTLDRLCPTLPVDVSTVHSFALTVVNRWRRSLDLARPITICSTPCGLDERNHRTQATFDELTDLASKLLESPTVRNSLGGTYPLAIVDEFQDCVGGTLKMVQNLGKACTLMLAADEFQFLQGDGVCPAVAWAGELREQGAVFYEDLAGCRRTNEQAILRAARALRDDVRATNHTVPVYWAPTPPMLAWRIVERFLPWSSQQPIHAGTCALIALSLDDPLLESLLQSFQNQLSRRMPKAQVRWVRQLTEEETVERLLGLLGISAGGAAGNIWKPPHLVNDSHAAAIAREIERFAKLRGIQAITHELVVQFARLSAHNALAFGRSSPRFQVLTVHGAKNREFDHVFVFWGYKSAGWPVEQQRRLLYNAVTRAKSDCTVLVVGNQGRIQRDSVLSLLGPALPAIISTPKGKRKSQP